VRQSVNIVAPHHGELACLQLARAYERATGWVEERRPPLLGPDGASGRPV